MPDTTQREYTDLLIRIHAVDKERAFYPVEAWVNDDVHFADGELHIDGAALQAAERDPTAYGLALFYALFAGSIRRAYDRATGYADAETHGRLRVRLWIDPRAVALHALAWERLHHLHQNVPFPITTLAQTPFSRYTGLDVAAPTPITARPIRMLVAIANPKDLADYNLTAIDVEQEITSLMQALGNLRETEQLKVTVLPGITPLSATLRARLEREGYTIADGATTLDAIIGLLSADQGYHILHLLSHGAYDGRRRANVLFWEDVDGYASLVKDKDIAAQISALDHPPHLIFAASCESAKRDPEKGNPFVGLAARLVQAGTPAVVAMQDTVPIAAARALSQHFYRHLLEHGIVDRAMSQTRLLLYDPGEPSWAIPALYMRLDNGQLFAADPVRTALRAMLQSDVFNPLPEGGSYLPLEARHLAGKTMNFDLDTLTLERTPGRGLLEAVLDILAPIKQEAGPYGPTSIAIIGGAGMGKSVEMRHIGQVTAQLSLDESATRIVIPVYIDLQELPQGTRIDSDSIETNILQALAPFWEPDSDQQPIDILNAYTGPILRAIIDGSESLPLHNRRRLCAALQRFIRTHPRHEYIVTFNTENFDPAPLTITDTLVILTLSQRNIQRYLTQTLSDETGKQLYAALEQSRLFDLASVPWLLFKMLQQTRAGKVPESHAQVLQDLADDAIADIAIDQGMRTRAAKTLYALAWRMQSTYRPTLTLDEAFEIMAAERGNRGYSLEKLYHELTVQGLLSPVGEESLRFARSTIRAYCCAQAILLRDDIENVLDDVTATLGRYTRYAWWEDTLILLSGLMQNPTMLIQKLLYGVALSEGEQVFLAANCIQECRHECRDEQLVNYVVNSLLWRLDSIREPRVARRVRIVQALGQLRHPAAIVRLVDVAHRKVQFTPLRELKHEHSSVRLAAVQALRRMVEPPYTEIANIAPQLAKLLNYWADEQVEAFIPYLTIKDDHDAEIEAIAAFALGHLQTERAVDVAIQMFLSPHFNQETRRNIVTALTLMDPATVTQRAILPLLDEETMTQSPVDARTPAAREAWHLHLAYLIGKVRAQEPRARAFLYRCLNESPDITLKGTAIQSIGWLYDNAAKTRFTDIALEDFTSLNLPAPLTQDERTYLQQKALDALYYIGDDDTVRRLQQRATGWSPELEIAFYRTVEHILSRQKQ